MLKKFFQKKQFMMVALVAALGVAVYLNYYMTQEPSLFAGADTSATESEDGDRLGEATFVGAPVSKEEGTSSSEESGEKTQSQNTDSHKDNASYFDTARANRTAAREQALNILQEVLDNVQASEKDKAAAAKQAAVIADNVLQESHAESLIVAKGFADCVVFIDGNNCSVVVPGADLQQQESVQIMEIVVSQSDVEAKNVQIVTSGA
ncbi:MAG: SpoIIIAH-like family protein [Clostridia bacterium]|nr:SpoIIIAH-like family protein [Loktanella sp.]MBQ1950036.1 SpoIIIAH-like family protein [Clostridia bacterium]